MATVFMRWLETTPGDYDRGIRLLTLGRLVALQEQIAREYIPESLKPGPQVLDIGCGTGRLAILMARQGARGTAIDASPAMLAEARCKAEAEGLQETIDFRQLDVTELVDHFEQASFDLVTSTLAFSEFPPEVRQYALEETLRLIKPDGQLLIADEMLPRGTFAQLLYWIVRLPLVILTWVLTRTTTTPLRGFDRSLSKAGFIPRQEQCRKGYAT